MSSKSPIASGLVLTVLIAFIFQIDNSTQMVNRLVDMEVSYSIALTISFLLRLILGFTLFIIIIPLFRNYDGKWRYYRKYVQISRKVIVIGLLSFLLFTLLSLALSLALGIFISDPDVIFGKPDINTDPDTIGWFYFFFALNPGIWEELGFRGIILSDLREKYSERKAIILSSFLFGLMHFSNMVFLSFEEALGGVIMSTLFGLFWGYLTVKTGSVLPAMISHYLIDAFGAVFSVFDTTLSAYWFYLDSNVCITNLSKYGRNQSNDGTNIILIDQSFKSFFDR